MEFNPRGTQPFGKTSVPIRKNKWNLHKQADLQKLQTGAKD